MGVRFDISTLVFMVPYLEQTMRCVLRSEKKAESIKSTKDRWMCILSIRSCAPLLAQPHTPGSFFLPHAHTLGRPNV